MMSADTEGVAMDSEKGIVASQWCALLYAMVSANVNGVAMDSEKDIVATQWYALSYGFKGM